MALLEGRGIRRGFDGTAVLDGVDISLKEGEILALMGPSGSGKTLLLRILAALEAMDAGEVRLEDQRPRDLGAPAWRSRVCWVPQTPPRLSGTPAEHLDRVVALGAQQGRESDDPVALAADWHLAEDVWDKAWSALSGGERQRASLAIALARRPQVLLLDEPTSALDRQAREAVERSLAGHTAIWVTHDADQAERMADRCRRLPRRGGEE